MASRSALEILKRRRQNNPNLQRLYVEEKKKYEAACRIRECRTEAGISRVQLAIQKDNSVQSTKLSMNPLRPYQLECIETIEKTFKKQNAQLIQLPTGSGKTRVFLEYIRVILKSKCNTIS